jgi:hypothetical protein
MDFVCLDPKLPAECFDSEAFKFAHQLLGHPALTPPVDSAKRLSETDNFESFFSQHGDRASIEQAIDSIRTSQAYIAVQSPQSDASYAPIFKDLINDIGQLLRLRGLGHAVLNKWSPALDQFGQAFDFGPGQALHIPFAAGHHVRNGPDDVSISMSIFFDTSENLRWRRALSFNHYVRRAMRPLGVAPRPVGHRPMRDGLKAALWSGLMSASLDAARSLRTRLRG